jgi:hypothetical protein
MTAIDWAHRESLRQWSILAAGGHPGAQAVANYHGLTPPPVTAPSVPRARRPAVPAVPAPTPALGGVQRRVDMITRAITPPVPPDLV